jgi:hypothetical protein
MTVRKCAAPGCPHLVRWVDRCHAHRTSTTPKPRTTNRKDTTHGRRP